MICTGTIDVMPGYRAIVQRIVNDVMPRYRAGGRAGVAGGCDRH